MSSAAQSKAERLCDGLIEAGWLGALVLLPLVVNIYAETRFELEKVVLLRSLAALIVAAWTIKLVLGAARGVRPRVSTSRWSSLPIAVAMVMLAHVVGSVISVAPRLSWWGTYIRQQGTLTLLCYCVLFLAVLTHLRGREQWQRMAFAILLTSVPISAQAIAEQLQLDPLGQGSQSARSIAMLGNPIFLGGYLIFPMFVALERLIAATAGWVSRWIYGAVLALQIMAFGSAQSRGPAAGLLVGLFLFSLVGLVRWRRRTVAPADESHAWGQWRRWAWLVPPSAAAIVVTLLFLLVLPDTPLVGAHQIPYLGRLSGMFDVQGSTAQVRVLIWRGVADLFEDPGGRVPPPDADPFRALRTPFGYGPETLVQVFGRYHPAELGRAQGWNTIPDRAHNETFDALVFNGVFGLAAVLALFLLAFRRAGRWLLASDRPNKKDGLLAFLLIGLATGIVVPFMLTRSLQFAAVGMPLGLLTGLGVWILREGFRKTDRAARESIEGARGVLVLALLAALAAHFVEIELGIAVTTTRAYFWTLLAVLAVVTSDRWGTDTDADPDVPENRSAVFGVLCGIAVTALAFDFFNLGAARDASIRGVLDGLFRGRVDGPPGAVWLLALTVVGGALLLAAELKERPTLRGISDFVLPGLLAPASFVLVHAVRLGQLSRLARGGEAEPAFDYLSGFYSAYHLVAIALIIAAGVIIADASGRNTRAAPGSGAGMAATIAIVGGVIWLAAIPGLTAVRADILYREGKRFAGARQWDGATRLYDLAIDRQPFEDSYYFWRGNAYVRWAAQTPDAAARERRFERALESLSRAAELNPLDPAHNANLGRLFNAWGATVPAAQRRSELWLRARAFFNRALQLHPGSEILIREREALEDRLAAMREPG